MCSLHLNVLICKQRNVSDSVFKGKQFFSPPGTNLFNIHFVKNLMPVYFLETVVSSHFLCLMITFLCCSRVTLPLTVEEVSLSIVFFPHQYGILGHLFKVKKCVNDFSLNLL